MIHGTFYLKIIKRFTDFFVSVILFLLLVPISLFLIPLHFFILGKPFLFVQERIGYNNKVFNLYKIRTMKNIKDYNGVLLPDNQRQSWFGNFLRKTSIDELPSLINVMRGEMSIVGPRPLLVEYLKLYNSNQIKRHNVRPGITGLAQISGRNKLNWPEKFNRDLEYVEKVSFLLDLKILIITFFKVFLLRNKDVNASDITTMEKFKGN